MEKDAEQIFHELKEDISTYVRLKYKLLRLNATERIAKLIAILSHGVILVLLVFFTVLFLFLALGFFLGEVLGSTALGFLIVGGIYLLLTVIAVAGRNRIQEKIINIIISALWANEDESDED